MEHKNINKIIASGVFLTSLAVYIKTMAPTVVFWDVGEFCAAAFSLQVPHPPGAPLFLLLGRIFSMIPFVQDIAVRMHTLSAIASAITCALLYLIIVDLISIWKGVPEKLFDKIILYTSGIIGALSLAFCSTFWFNAVEAEVYGLSMAFVSLSLYLGVKWYQRPETESGDKYLLLIAYVIGLSIGVHLLAVLTLFPIMLLWYFREYKDFTWKSFIIFSLIGLTIFAIVYPGVVKILPSMLDGEIWGMQNDVITFIPVVILLVSCYGIYYSIWNKKRKIFITLASFLLIVLGYSTYTAVYIRANAHPPMNENDPSTVKRLVSYLNREQYGDAPVLKRRWDPDPVKTYFHNKYSSDFDYMLKYQIIHMYFRYLGWNYIGIESDVRDAGVNWKQLYLIPFLLGIVGMGYQWWRQPKLAFIMTVTFIIMGVVLALYQNQQQPQPRERDYFYAGSFFVFSLWIAYGILALVDIVRLKVKKTSAMQLISYGLLVLSFIFVPINMVRANYHHSNRAGNYLAWDYSYNLLQSCEKDAILITNGDNDTFPLWYLQDVEGIRRDIRIVNLSLANASWYIKQLKHEMPYGAKKVPISIEDIEIDNIRPYRYEPTWMEVPVSPKVIQQYILQKRSFISPLDTSIINRGVFRFLLPHSIEYRNMKFLRVQDIVLYNIVYNSKFERPIYFAVTVPDDGKIGLQNYMQMTGLAFKLVPFKSEYFWANMDEDAIYKNLMTENVQPMKEPQYGFLWRGLNDSTVYYDEDSRRLITANYRNTFLAYAIYTANVRKQMQEVSQILERMEKLIPRNFIRMDYRLKYDIASLYSLLGDTVRYNEYANELTSELRLIIDKKPLERLSEYNPYIVMYYLYEGLKKYDDAESILLIMKSVYNGQKNVEDFVEKMRSQLEIKRNEKSKINFPQKPKK